MASGCKALAKGLMDLNKIIGTLPKDEQVKYFNGLMQNVKCVECTQGTNISNINAGGQVSIGDINQIMACGIGESMPTDKINLFRTNLNTTNKDIEKNISTMFDNIKTYNKNYIQETNNIIDKKIKLAIRNGGIVAGIIFVLLVFLLIIKAI